MSMALHRGSRRARVLESGSGTEKFVEHLFGSYEKCFSLACSGGRRRLITDHGERRT